MPVPANILVLLIGTHMGNSEALSPGTEMFSASLHPPPARVICKYPEAHLPLHSCYPVGHKTSNLLPNLHKSQRLLSPKENKPNRKTEQVPVGHCRCSWLVEQAL